MSKKQWRQQEEDQESIEKMSLMVDYAFKRVFGTNGNESMLKDLLEAILEIRIEKIVIQNPEITKNIRDAKIGILDVRAKIDEEKIIEVEMQITNQHNIDKRSTQYLSKIYSDQLKEGETYIEAKRVITINILNFNYYKRNAYHSIARMKFEETKPERYIDMGYKEEEKNASEEIEMHFIELPKFLKKKPDIEDRLEQWLCLISGKGEEIGMIIERNSEIRKANKEVEKLSQDKEERELYELRLKAIRDEENIRLTGIEEGMARGLRKGRIQGRKAGLKEGLEVGRNERNIEIAKNMLKKGMEIKDISEITGLSIEEIENIDKK